MKHAIGTVVSYRNGQPFIQTGTIMQIINERSYIIVNMDDHASRTLWNAGFSIGDQIQEEQVIN